MSSTKLRKSSTNAGLKHKSSSSSGGESSRRNPSSSSSNLSCWYAPLSCFSQSKFRHDIGNSIRSLNLRLDNILKDIQPLRLRESVRGLRDYPTDENGISRKTSPLVEPDLVGDTIEDSTRSMVDLLLSRLREHQKMSVFAIVGMGGIGKTTLVQKIYNDDRLRAHFTHIPPIWVCVSKNFSETDLLKAIIMRAGGNPGEAKDRADLEPILEEIVKNKNFFLVLDDVWDAKVWTNLLYKPLQKGYAGSRILVTTRDRAVANGMDAVFSHEVEKLSDEDGWSLISKMVFQQDRDGADAQHDFKDIGMRIVKKCDGLPLALKTTAGVLRTKDKKQSEWEKVLENPAWSATELPDGVMGALYLSYEDLRSEIKQCFVYFALFPEDALLNRDSCIQHWISEGFVRVRSNCNLTMEDLAQGYWNELVERSLRQPHPGYYNSLVCKIHDLLRTLAQHLALDECFCGDIAGLCDNASSSSSSLKPIRMNITDTGGQNIDVILGQESLRTLRFPDVRNFSKDVTKKLRRLRILNLCYSSIEKLPSYLGNLVHLRYLNLSYSSVREIPESIGSLINLQFLVLVQCAYLQKLPNSIIALCNLRSLILFGTPLNGMPMGMGRLGHLHRLVGFMVSNRYTGKKVGDVEAVDVLRRHQNNVFCTLEELNSLSHLRILTIYKLEGVSSRAEARTAALKAKDHLAELELHCTPCVFDVKTNAPQYDDESIKRIKEVFEELCPPSSIELLKIEGYFGLEYPSWMTVKPTMFLPQLRYLVLESCSFCGQLPPLGLLPHLEYLTISGASEVTSIGPELLLAGSNIGSRVGEGTYSSRSSFPKLKEIIFKNMPKWEQWWWLIEEEDQLTQLLPCLGKLILEGCPKLQSLPDSLLRHATALTRVRIDGAQSLTQVNHLLSVKELELIDNSCLERLSNLPSLKDLSIIGCEELSKVETLDALQYLEIRGSNLMSLPEWFLTAGQPTFTALQRLVIQCNTQLLSRCRMEGPDWPKIRHIPYVEAYTPDDLFYIFYTKSSSTFNTNLPSDIEEILLAAKPIIEG